MLNNLNKLTATLKTAVFWFSSIPGIISFLLSYYLYLIDNYGYAISFTISILTCIFVIFGIRSLFEIYELLFPEKRPIPFNQLLGIANKNGWKILDSNSLEILDLCYALRNAGRTGELQFFGKKHKINYIEDVTMNATLEPIPAKNWSYFKIDWVNILNNKNGIKKHEILEDNFRVTAYAYNSDSYKDLHIYCPNIKKWLKTAHRECAGRHQKQEDSRNEHMRLYDEIDAAEAIN